MMIFPWGFFAQSVAETMTMRLYMRQSLLSTNLCSCQGRVLGGKEISNFQHCVHEMVALRTQLTSH